MIHLFRLTDGVIVRSWFKDEHVDTGHVNEKYVRQIVGKRPNLGPSWIWLR